MNSELKNLFTGLTRESGLETIDVIMLNEAFNVLFSEIIDDTVATECNVKKLLALVSAVRENNFETISKQNVKWSNIVLLLITQIMQAMCLTRMLICENCNVY